MLAGWFGTFKGTLKFLQGRIVVKGVLFVLTRRVMIKDGRVPVTVTGFIPAEVTEAEDFSGRFE